MPFRITTVITNYRGDDRLEHAYCQEEHTTIGLIRIQNEALEKYYELYPNADEKEYLKISNKINYTKECG
jgi:hypothetical protein